MGIQPLVDFESFEKLRTKERKHHILSSIFNYDILSNFRYSEIFFYQALDQRIEVDGVIDHSFSDNVTVALKLGEKPYNKDPT